jgi:hypothetical protein
MQASICLLRTSRSNLHRSSFSYSGDSATASIAVLAPLDLAQDGGEGPNKRNEVAVLLEHVLVLVPLWLLQLNPARPKGNGNAFALASIFLGFLFPSSLI